MVPNEIFICPVETGLRLVGPALHWPKPVGMYPGASRPDETGLRPVGILTGTGLRPRSTVGLIGLWPVGIYPGASRPDETGLRPVGILTGTGLWPVLHRPAAGVGPTEFGR